MSKPNLSSVGEEKKQLFPAQSWWYFDSVPVTNALNTKILLFNDGYNSSRGGNGYHDWRTGTPPVVNPLRATTIPNAATPTVKEYDQSNYPSVNGELKDDFDFVVEKVVIGLDGRVNDTIIKAVMRMSTFFNVYCNKQKLFSMNLGFMTQTWGLTSPNVSSIGIPSIIGSGIDIRTFDPKDRLINKDRAFYIEVDYSKERVGGCDDLTYTVADLETSGINHVRLYGLIIGQVKFAATK